MNKTKRVLITAMSIVALSLSLFGCGQSDKANTTGKYPTAINMTYVKSPLNIPSIIEKEQKIFEKEFEKEKIAINYAQIDSGAKQTEAIAAGSIDIAHALGGTSAILAAANGVDVKIIGMYSRAPEAFTIIVTDPAIKSVADLKGKTVAGPKGTILHQLLMSALKKEGLSANDVNFVSMGIPESAAALSGGSVQAALLAGPIAIKAQDQGARVLVNGKGLLEASIVIGVRNDFLKKHPDVVKRFLASHQKVVADYQKNPQSFYAPTMKETGLSENQINIMSPWYDFTPTIKDSDIKDLEATQDFLIATGMLPKEKKINIQSMIATVK